MRERRKEPREGSEIDPETACIQTVGALASLAFSSSTHARPRACGKRTQDEIGPAWRITAERDEGKESVPIERIERLRGRREMDAKSGSLLARRANQARVTAYLLYNGSATYVVWRA